MRRNSNSPWKFLGIVILLGLVGGFAWWFFAPAFIDDPVNEPLPVVSVDASPTPSTAQVAPATQPVDIQPQPTTEVPASATDQILTQGSFYDLAHLSSGEALVYQLADASRILRLQNFSIDNGPDLYVYLVPVDPVPNASGSDIPGYYSLGRLKGNIGNQNYELPADLDLTQYKSVVIWCQAFAVPFAAAPLTPP